MSPLRRRSQVPVAFIVLALVAVACGGPKSSRGVSVDEISTNVGLGIEVLLDAAPPSIVVTAPIPRQSLDIPRRTIPPIVTAAPVKNQACPNAGPFDFAAIDAGVDPDPRVRPKAGDFRWKLDGKVVTDEGPVKIDEFETRQLKDVGDDSAAQNAFHFTVTQTRLFDNRLGSGSLETTYRVVPTAQTSSVPNTGVGNAPVAPADTGRGMYLVSIVFKGTNDEGNPTESRFDPSAPLLMLPFPVEDGLEINSTGADPQTGTQLTIAGHIAGKKQVDACGDRVDTWLVDAVQTLRVTNPDTLQTETFESNYDYGVAPQYGSQLLYERVEAPRDGPIITVSARVGKVPERTVEGG